jgi:uncharacterized surface protein with fasciclin (FAS1) repeats
MKKNITLSATAVIKHAILGILTGICLIACDYNKKLDLQITSNMNITGYLQANPDQFSSLLELMDRDITLTNGSTIKYSSFLAAYGTYTLFAPTNTAISTYLTEKGLTNVSQLTNNEVEDLLNFHILQDTISTTSFTDGKLGVATMYGQYLVTGSSYDGTTTRIRVNKQAYVTTKNIKLGNGVIHVIDGVLKPAEHTIAYMLENDGRFTFFSQALRETGYYDTLDVVSTESAADRRWLSVMATPDSVYIANGIADYPALKATYCNTGVPTDPADSLHLYIGYHILEGLKFIADLASSSTYATLTPNQVISIKISSDTVLINELTVNGVLEKGIPIQRYKSDNSSKNGVWHILDNDYYIKTRTISRVFFDFCDYDGIRSKVSNWGLPIATSLPIFNGDIKGITYSATSTAYAYATYYAQATQSTTSAQSQSRYIHYNDLQLTLRNNAGIKWIKFTTPFIAAGKYKVWMAWRRTGYACTTSVMIDSIDMPIIPDFYATLPGRNSRTLEAYDNYLQGLGYKRPYQIKSQTNYICNTGICQYIGTVTLTTSSTHWIKFTTLTATRSAPWLDYVEFIPVDDDQIWPKYDEDGTAWPRPADGYDDATTAIY